MEHPEVIHLHLHLHLHRLLLSTSTVPMADRSLAAAATILSLVANLLTLGTPASQLPQQLYSLAYSRSPGEPSVLYNGIDFRLLAEASSSTASQASTRACALAVSSNDSMLLNDAESAMPAASEDRIGAGQGIEAGASIITDSSGNVQNGVADYL